MPALKLRKAPASKDANGVIILEVAAAPQEKDIAAMSFEAALKELETIVARLEQGDVDLEDSITLYERGQALKMHCDGRLKTAESRLEKLVLDSGGQPVGLERLELG